MFPPLASKGKGGAGYIPGGAIGVHGDPDERDRGDRHGFSDDHDDGHFEIMIDLVRISKCIADFLEFEGSGFDPWERSLNVDADGDSR